MSTLTNGSATLPVPATDAKATVQSTNATAKVQYYQATVRSIMGKADANSTLTVGIICGTKVSKSGGITDVYATVRIESRECTLEGALKALEALGDAPVKVSIPAVTDGQLRLQLTPIMAAAKFAALCRA